MRRQISIIAAVLLAAGAAGCGGGNEPTTAAQTGSSTQTAQTASAASPAAATSTTTDAPGAPVSTSTCSSITDGTTEGPYYVTGTAELTDGNLNYDSLPGDAIAIAGYVDSGTAKTTPLANAAVDIW